MAVTTKRDAKALGKQLAGYHSILALATSCPELKISEEEGTTLAQAYGDICEHYQITALPREVTLWLALVSAGGTIYGPRAIQIYVRKSGGKSPLDMFNRSRGEPGVTSNGPFAMPPNGNPTITEAPPPGVLVMTTGQPPKTGNGMYKL